MTGTGAKRSGDGFVRVADGTRRWGRFGAAGVLVRHVEAASGAPSYFLARRSEWVHLGGSWAVPGGAIDEDETPLAGALREFHEEIGIELTAYEVVAEHVDDLGGWSYTTYVVDVGERFTPPERLQWETAAVGWFSAEEIGALELFAPFAATLSRLGLP